MQNSDPNQERVLKAYRRTLCESRKNGRPASLMITIVPPGILKIFKILPEEKDLKQESK